MTRSCGPGALGGDPIAGRASLSQPAEENPPDAALAEWLVAIGRGERDALAILYGQTAPRLMAVLVRLLHRRELAEEALHDVFVRVWHRAASFDPARGSAMGWLVAIARNIAFDHHRRYRRELASLVDPIEELADPASDAGLSLARRALLACLDRLEPEPRRCVLLAYQGGYSYDELSIMLKRPTGTIKSWVRRSLQRLRACLEAG